MYYIASISSFEYKVHINCFKGSIFSPCENDMHAVLWKNKMTIFYWFFSNIRRTITILFCNISEAIWYIPITFCRWTFGYITFTNNAKSSFWPETCHGPNISWPARIVVWKRYNINDVTRNRFKNYFDKKHVCNALIDR